MVWLFFYYPTLFALSCHNPYICVHKTVAFRLTLAFALHVNALEISSHVSSAAYLLQKEKISKKWIYSCVLWMHFFTVKTKTKMASWTAAFHLFPLEIFVDLIHWFVKKFYLMFEKHFSQWILEKWIGEKFQISSHLVSLCWTLWVSVGLVQYVLKCPAPKFGPWNLRSFKWDSIKLRAHCFQNFILCTVCWFSETVISCISMDHGKISVTSMVF